MIEIVQLLSSIAAIICGFSGTTTWFYIIGSIVVFIDAIGILTGQIKKSAPIIMCVLFAVIFSLIFDYNIYANIIFVLCLECIYTYIKGIIAILKIKRIGKNAEMCDSNFDEMSEATEGINTDTILKEQSNAIFLENKTIYMIPLYECVSAGFGAYASDYIVDYVPCYVASKAEADESLCIVVSGDSMYPKIESGDTIQVHKQSSVDSGAIAVVLVDKTEALVKRVIYGNDWIELHSINPMYPPQRFEGKDVLRIEVVGLVKKVIKDV